MKRLRKLAAALALTLGLTVAASGCDLMVDGPGMEQDPSNQNVTISREDELSVHLIDVGQADSILVKTPSGKNVLIDTGNRDDYEIIDQYLQKEGVDKLELLILTHPHEDHIGSAAKVITNYPIKKICMPDVTTTTRVFERTVDAIAQSGAKVIYAKPGVKIFDEGDVHFEVVGPNSPKYSNLNNYSVVARMTYGDRSFMFTGDAEVGAEEEILANHPHGLQCDVLKVGHHGSDTSTSPEFLAAVSPQYAAISCGKDNDYGHPCQVTLDKLEKAGVKTFRTDLEGAIVFRTDGVNLVYETASESGAAGQPSQTKIYIGNKNSKIFHKPGCSSKVSEKNQVVFESRQEAIDAGYTPCSRCNP